MFGNWDNFGKHAISQCTHYDAEGAKYMEQKENGTPWTALQTTEPAEHRELSMTQGKHRKETSLMKNVSLMQLLCCFIWFAKACNVFAMPLTGN